MTTAAIIFWIVLGIACATSWFWIPLLIIALNDPAMHMSSNPKRDYNKYNNAYQGPTDYEEYLEYRDEQNALRD